MTPETQRAINRKCLRAADRLQREKYELTGLTRKQFYPCPRGLVYTANIEAGRVMSEIQNEAIGTHCECHPDFDLKKCLDYENDEVME